MKGVFHESIRRSRVQSSKRNEGGERKRVGEKELSRAEIRKTIRRLNNRKAARIDGIPEEVWNYEPREIDVGIL